VIKIGGREMFQNDIKVSIYGRDDFGTVDLVIWRPLDEDLILVFRENDEGNFSWTEDSANGEVRPSLRIPRSNSVNILQLMVDEIKGQFGIKATADKVYESELQATQSHLEDMRSLVFKSDWIEIQNGSQAVEEGIE